MATWATKRKITYLAIALSVVFIIAAIPASLILYRPASCFDSKQNQGEEGIDCGGPCQLQCKSKTLDPIVLWQRFFEVSPGVYNAVAYVQNPNVASAAYNVPYVFRLYDDKNFLIYERKGTTSIAPIVTTPVFESAIATGGRKPARITFEFTEKPDWFAWQTQAPKIAITDQNLDVSGNTPVLSATLTNTTLKTVPSFEVVAVLFDADGTAFAASKTVVDALPAEKSVPLSFSWREALPGQAVRIDLLPKLFPGIQY